MAYRQGAIYSTGFRQPAAVKLQVYGYAQH